MTVDELRTKLSPEQYRITQESGTERAFTGIYWNHKGKGTYAHSSPQTANTTPAPVGPATGNRSAKTPSKVSKTTATAWFAPKFAAVAAMPTSATFSPTAPNQPGFAIASTPLRSTSRRATKKLDSGAELGDGQH